MPAINCAILADKARIFLLVDLQEFFSDLGSGSVGRGEGGGRAKKIVIKRL